MGMASDPAVAGDPIRPQGDEACLPAAALFVWIVLSWVGVARLDSLAPWGAAGLLLVTLLWMAWAWSPAWLALGIVALVAAMLLGHDAQSVALRWYQAFAALVLIFGSPIVFGASPEHWIPTIEMVVLGLILFPVFAKARDKANQSTCVSIQGAMAAACLAYTQDYDGYLPPANLPSLDVVRPYVKYLRGERVDSDRVLFCPADDNGPPSYALVPSHCEVSGSPI